MSCLYILEINPLSLASFANIFSRSEGCRFVLFMVSFAVQKLLKFMHCWVAFRHSVGDPVWQIIVSLNIWLRKVHKKKHMPEAFWKKLMEIFENLVREISK